MARQIIVSNPEWAKCIELFIASAFDISGSAATVEHYTSILARFFSDNPDPDKVTKTTVLAFLQKPSTCRGRQGQPVSAATKNARLACLNSLYKYASCYEVLMADGSTHNLFTRALPTQAIRYVKPNAPVRSMSEAETRAFFNAINPRSEAIYARDFSMFLAFWLTCSRRSALARLRVGDLAQATLIDQDGSSRQGWTFSTTVKGNSRRTVVAEMPPAAMQSIREYWRIAGRLDPKPEEPVWMATKASGPGQDGTQFMNPDYINARFHFYVKRAGLRQPERFSLHSLRWSGARALFENGVDLIQVQHALGHSQISTTFRYLARDVASCSPARALEGKFGNL